MQPLTTARPVKNRRDGRRQVEERSVIMSLYLSLYTNIKHTQSVQTFILQERMQMFRDLNQPNRCKESKVSSKLTKLFEHTEFAHSE